MSFVTGDAPGRGFIFAAAYTAKPRTKGADMASVCFYFQVHQPFRLRRYSVFDTDRHYFDDYKNAEICRKVAHKCYLPANRTLLETIRIHEGRFRIAYSITGVAP